MVIFIGIVIRNLFCNMALIDWVSKKQATIETSVFGAEFVAMKHGIEKLNSRNDTSINVEHCETNYEFNIKKMEFGNESLWLLLPPKNG